MVFSRRIKYYYLRLARIRGEPHELAIGTALGVFSGMMPIIPFQIALAIVLALFFRGSKITAALGTWVTNPLNWYLIYLCNYKLGASIIGVPRENGIISSVIDPFQNAEGYLHLIGEIAGAGTTIIASFLLGGFIMGLVAALPSYLISLRFFRFVRRWRQKRRDREVTRKPRT
ncbi:MAG: DUF2062 domain-containing protein [Deltaproteobacteria bacterium]|nr:DUF2062 domain-containing protein [Deltaproteobacteria bacterium]